MLTVTGSAEELGVALEKLFGPGNSVRIENDYGFQLMQSVSYTDSIQLSAFFEEAELTGTNRAVYLLSARLRHRFYPADGAAGRRADSGIQGKRGLLHPCPPAETPC